MMKNSKINLKIPPISHEYINVFFCFSWLNHISVTINAFIFCLLLSLCRSVAGNEFDAIARHKKTPPKLSAALEYNEKLLFYNIREVLQHRRIIRVKLFSFFNSGRDNGNRIINDGAALPLNCKGIGLRFAAADFIGVRRIPI